MASRLFHLVMFLVLLMGEVAAHYNMAPNALHDLSHFTQKNSLNQSDIHIGLTTLEEIYHELFEKLECEEKVANCTQCLGKLESISEEINDLSKWNEMSITVLHAALNITSFCALSKAEMKALNTADSLLDIVGGGQSIDSMGDEEIESLLDMLSAAFTDDHHHEEETTTVSSQNSTTVDADHGDEHDHEHADEHGDEHGPTQCFGEGTVLNYMGLDHEEPITKSRVPELAGIIISFLAQDMVVQETCEALPRKYDVINSIFNSLEVIDEEAFEHLLETLNIGSQQGGATEVPAGDGHDGHDHKRSIEEAPLTSQCMGEGQLATMYGLDLEHGITKDEFVELCPALIQQQISGSCSSVESTTVATEAHVVSNREKYGYGTLAVIIISLLSLLGALLIPCLNAQLIRYILSMFVAMGVATMVGDSLLHLLPQALGLHSHGEGAEKGSITVSDTIKVQIVVCAAIYGFYLFEYMMSRVMPSTVKPQPLHGHSHEITGASTEKDGSTEKGGSTEKSGWTEKDQSVDSEQSSTNTEVKGKGCNSIPSVAIMILVGDIIHNLIDGIAIGAAFSQSVEDGIGTSIAVFCHELPHELGDFSIFLKSGLSKGKAILFNVVAASVCLIGLYIGAAIAENAEARKWLLALTAGMFIYVALVNMMPELLAPIENGKWWIHFILQNIGMVLGICIMLLIAIYEEEIIHNH